MCPKKCAVLVCSNIAFPGADAFWNDMVMIREMLLAKGFPENNIFVLYGTGTDFRDAHRKNPRYRPDKFVNYAATPRNLKKVLKGLANGNPDPKKPIEKMSGDDYLFVWTFGHGRRDPQTNHSKLRLLIYADDPWDDEAMPDNEFACLIKNIKCSYRVIAMQQCYSGGFIDDFDGEKIVILTSCDAMEISQGVDGKPSREIETCPQDNEKYHHGEFNFYLYEALLRGDTMQQAFQYIMREHSTDETPRCYFGVNNIGANWTL